MENYLAVNLRLLRKSRHLNQTDFAEILGKKTSIVGPYEKGDVEPDITSLIKISKYYGISISDLITKDLTKEGDHSNSSFLPTKEGKEDKNELVNLIKEFEDLKLKQATWEKEKKHLEEMIEVMRENLVTQNKYIKALENPVNERAKV